MITPKDFAKVFHLPELGQVVVFKPEDGEGDHEGSVVLAIYASPPHLGLCSVKLCYEEWDLAEEKFAAMDEDLVKVACEGVLSFSKRIDADL